jgi:hypothetical protein
VRPPLTSPKLVVVLLAAAVLAGCGDDGDDVSSSTTTTVEATTTTSAVEVTTTTPATTPADLGELPAFHDDRASGSGCTPGDGDLPDGWWYAASVTADPAAGTYAFDLACYYVGAAAESEAASRGDEVNNDYYVVNDNPTLRTLPLAAGATARCVELGAGVVDVDCSPSDIPDPETPWAVWLRVVDGEIDRLVEQYAP